MGVERREEKEQLVGGNVPSSGSSDMYGFSKAKMGVSSINETLARTTSWRALEFGSVNMVAIGGIVMYVKSGGKY